MSDISNDKFADAFWRAILFSGYDEDDTDHYRDESLTFAVQLINSFAFFAGSRIRVLDIETVEDDLTLFSVIYDFDGLTYMTKFRKVVVSFEPNN